MVPRTVCSLIASSDLIFCRPALVCVHVLSPASFPACTACVEAEQCALLRPPCPPSPSYTRTIGPATSSTPQAPPPSPRSRLAGPPHIQTLVLADAKNVHGLVVLSGTQRRTIGGLASRRARWGHAAALRLTDHKPNLTDKQAVNSQPVFGQPDQSQRMHRQHHVRSRVYHNTVILDAETTVPVVPVGTEVPRAERNTPLEDPQIGSLAHPLEPHPYPSDAEVLASMWTNLVGGDRFRRPVALRGPHGSSELPSRIFVQERNRGRGKKHAPETDPDPMAHSSVSPASDSELSMLQRQAQTRAAPPALAPAQP